MAILKNVELPERYRIDTRMLEGRKTFVPQFYSGGEWTDLAWNKMDYVYLSEAFKNPIAFSTKKLAITFILGFNWHL